MAPGVGVMLRMICTLAVIMAASLPASAAYWSGYGDWVRALKDQECNTEPEASALDLDAGEPSAGAQLVLRAALPRLADPSDSPVRIETGIGD